MRKKNFKGRCEKRVLGKCAEVCSTYDAILSVGGKLLLHGDIAQNVPKILVLGRERIVRRTKIRPCAVRLPC